MRYLLLILLAATMSMNMACSKKKSSSVATAPPTQPAPNDPTYPPNTGYTDIVGLPAPLYSYYYAGVVTNVNRTTYKKFLKSAFGYQTYHTDGLYGGNNNYSYSYSYGCDLNIFRWIFGGDLLNCGSNQYNQFENYINDLSYGVPMIQLVFPGNGKVRGLWLVDAVRQFNYQTGKYDYYAVKTIPFQGHVYRMNDGRYVIESGPLAFVTANSINNFDVYFENVKFGNVTIQ